MATDFTDLGLRLHLVGLATTNPLTNAYTGGDQPSDPYYCKEQFQAGAATGLIASINATFDPATVITDIRVKLQGMPRPEFASLFGGAGAWVDLPSSRISTGANPTVEQIFIASPGNPVVDALAIGASLGLHPRFFYQLRLLAKYTTAGGGAKAGDIVYGYVNAF
jgi:hypothetical protein